MNYIKQHIPSFCSGIEPNEAKFDGLQELLSISFIQDWLNDPVFSFFSQDIFIRHIRNGNTYDYLLIAHMRNKQYWVVGYLSYEVIGLPDFGMIKK